MKNNVIRVNNVSKIFKLDTQIGISKKIEARNERLRLKEILLKNLPKGMGAIVRTTAENRTAKDIMKDLSFLISAWKSIKRKFPRRLFC